MLQSVLGFAPNFCHGQEGQIVSFKFRLWSQDEESEPAIVFEDSTSPGFVPLWEAVGVYDALYNSDGKQARDISRAIAFGVDRINDDPKLAALAPSSLCTSEAIRFLENVHRACVIHASARVATV
jgi:hypothetical protein